MRFGICRGIGDPAAIAAAERAGMDYLECNFTDLSRADDAVFETYAAALEKSSLRCEAANCFIPGDLKILGDALDKDALSAFILNGLRRGSRIGLKTIVFGSGGARSIPDGMPYAEAARQFVAVLKDVISPLLTPFGVRVVIEPLNAAECNFINRVKEGAVLAALADSENIGLLADLYHMVRSADDCGELPGLKGLLHHAHISYPQTDRGMNRSFPTDPERYDYLPFLRGLIDAGVETCSIEAGCKDFEAELLAAGACLNRLKQAL